MEGTEQGSLGSGEGLAGSEALAAAARDVGMDGKDASTGGLGMMDGFWNMADRIVVALGMRLDIQVPWSTKAIRVIQAQNAVMEDIYTCIWFCGIALFLLLLAAFFGGRRMASKCMCIMLSMMWASQGLLILGEVVAKSGGEGMLWPIEGVITFMVFMGESLIFAILGTSGFILFNTPLSRLKSDLSHQTGLLLLITSFLMPAVHKATDGTYCKLPFAIDIFTAGLVFSSAVDTGYSKQVWAVIPYTFFCCIFIGEMFT